MTERNVIESQIAKKQSEIENYEEKIKAAKVYIAALRDVLKLLDKPKNIENENDDSETKLRQGSAVAQARDIILNRGEPIHIDELLEAMGKEVSRDTKASLAGSLAAYVRRQDIFTRTAPNTYGLIELDHFEYDDNDVEEAAPPPGFGSGSERFQTANFEDDLDVPF